jgi:glycerol kinase
MPSASKQSGLYCCFKCIKTIKFKDLYFFNHGNKAPARGDDKGFCMSRYLLAIDQGTTSSRALVFNSKAQPVSLHQIDLKQTYPSDGWVEQDPEEMWMHTLECCRNALQKAHLSPTDIIAIGITNQRETTIIWDRKTGQPIYPAIVWQDRRTTAICKEFMSHPIHAKLQAKTGLLLDPYFSATKILWLLENIPGARQRAERGELAFGTVDTFLLWRLTQGRVHATDATNASRTLLFNIRTQAWDAEILEAFCIPEQLLPEVRDSAAHFGDVDASFFGKAIPINAMIGDQQAATVGQACFSPGMVKATYGTGGFVLLNTGSIAVQSKSRLLATVAYRLQGKTTYGLEGSFFSAGATVKWLRDALKIIHTAAETENIAESITDNSGVYLVPAFTGLGAPYWDPGARAAIVGLTTQSDYRCIARAALESVCYQTHDLLECMKHDGASAIDALRVDGGMAANNWLLQFLSNMLGITVQRSACIETTALGAAFLAGLQAGVYQSLEEISHLWQANAVFLPKLTDSDRAFLYQGWEKAVARIVTHSE